MGIFYSESARLGRVRLPIASLVCAAWLASAVACSDRIPLPAQAMCKSDADCPPNTTCQNQQCVRPADDLISITAVNGTSLQTTSNRARVDKSGTLQIQGAGLDGATAVRLLVKGSTQLVNLAIATASAATLTATLPASLEVSAAGLQGTLSVIHPTRGVASAEVQMLRGEDQLVPGNVMVRKSTCDAFPSGAACINGSPSLAIAYCEANEILLSGGCMIPGAGDGAELRAMVSMTSAPIDRLTNGEHPVVQDESEGRQGFVGDLVPFNNAATTSSSAISTQGKGWYCETLGTLNDIGSSPTFQSGWKYNVSAYAICARGTL